MAASIVTPTENVSLKRVFDEFSLLMETLEYRQIGGWLYTRLVPLGGKDRPAPPAWLFSILIRAVPSIRRRIRGSVEAMRSDKAGKLIDRWYAEWQPGLSRRLAELRDVDLQHLSDQALEQHLDRAIAHFTEAAGIHFMLHAPGAFALAELTFTCRDMLGWDEVRTLNLVAGLSTMSTEPARRLAELARLGRDRPAVRSLLEHVDSTTARRLADVIPSSPRPSPRTSPRTAAGRSATTRRTLPSRKRRSSRWDCSPISWLGTKIRPPIRHRCTHTGRR